MAAYMDSYALPEVTCPKCGVELQIRVLLSSGIIDEDAGTITVALSPDWTPLRAHVLAEHGVRLGAL